MSVKLRRRGALRSQPFNQIMPLIDLNLTGARTEFERPQFVIVGAGAAGIFLASKLARMGRRVLLIESGHFVESDDRQELNRIEETGKPQGNSIWNRKRVLGGTTTAWGGAIAPILPFGF